MHDDDLTDDERAAIEAVRNRPAPGTFSGRYRIQVDGCDDSTEIIMALSRPEAALIGRVAAAISEASRTQCMPTMGIEPVEGE